MNAIGVANKVVGAVALVVALGGSNPGAAENLTYNEWRFQREIERAQTGDVDAQARVGLLLQEGQGTPADPEEAARWYRLAAEQGSKAATFGLAMLYHSGNGVEQNFEEAMKLLRPVAEDGLALAQALVGIMTFRGEGVEADPIVAYAWLATAARLGEREAEMSAKTVAESMTAEQLHAARGLAKQYWSDYVLRSRAKDQAAERRSRSELDEELRRIQAEGDRRRNGASTPLRQFETPL